MCWLIADMMTKLNWFELSPKLAAIKTSAKVTAPWTPPNEKIKALRWLLAEEIHVSGIIAVVCAGLLHNSEAQRSRFSDMQQFYLGNNIFSLVQELLNNGLAKEDRNKSNNSTKQSTTDRCK